MSSKNFDRALVLAAEYRKHIEVGEPALAAQARRTIEELNVGGYVDGKYTLPAPIRQAMGVEA